MAIDIGAASGRAIVGYLKDKRLVTKEIHRFTNGDVFWIDKRIRNIYNWYEEIIVALQKYSQQFGAELYSIGVDSMGEDFALIDKAGQIIMLPPSYRSVSVDRELLEIEERDYGNEEIYNICGNQSVANDTLRQLISIINKESNVIERADGLLFLGDVFHYLLCGNRSVEHSLASYGKLYNQHKQCWEDSIFEAFQIPKALKGNIVYCGDHIGNVHQEICRDGGIEYGTKVIVPSTHDTACAALAVPDEKEDWAFISSGSWSLMGIQTDAPIINKEAWKFNCSNSSMPIRKNMFKKLIAGMWIIQRCKREWKIESFDEIVECAKTNMDNNYYFDPDTPELYNPDSMTRQICSIIKRNYGDELNPNDVKSIARICFESLALKYRYVLDKLESISNRQINKIYILGGGSKNALLNQLSADACNRPVFTGIEEASAIGNILCQMYGSKEITENEVKQILRDSYSLTSYRPGNKELWEHKYEEYLRSCCLNG